MKLQFPLLMLFSSLLFLPSLSAASTFSDVPESHPHYSAITYFHTLEAVTGYDDGTFKPDQPVNRAEALKMIFAGSPSTFVINPNIEKDLFPDVAKDTWFAPFVGKALELTIINGNSDGTFAPARTVNKAEFMKMLLLANQVPLPKYETTPEALSSDVPGDSWFYPYMAYGKEYSMIVTNIDGALEPAKELSRGEVLQIMYKYIVNVKGGQQQELLSRTEAKLVSSMEKVATGDYQAALTLSEEAITIAMEGYELNPAELIVVDAAKTAKAYNALVRGYIAVEQGDTTTGKTAIQEAIQKAEEITHPSVASMKETIIQLSKKVLAQIIAIENSTK